MAIDLRRPKNSTATYPRQASMPPWPKRLSYIGIPRIFILTDSYNPFAKNGLTNVETECTRIPHETPENNNVAGGSP